LALDGGLTFRIFEHTHALAREKRFVAYPTLVLDAEPRILLA
jgi:hypothetical protein